MNTQDRDNRTSLCIKLQGLIAIFAMSVTPTLAGGWHGSYGHCGGHGRHGYGHHGYRPHYSYSHYRPSHDGSYPYSYSYRPSKRRSDSYTPRSSSYRSGGTTESYATWLEHPRLMAGKVFKLVAD